MDIATVGIVLIAVVIIVLILGCAYKLAGNGEQDFDEIYTPSPLIQEKAGVNKGKKSVKAKKSKIKPKVVNEELIVNRVEVESNENVVGKDLRQRSSAAKNGKQEQDTESSSPTPLEPPVAGNKKSKNKNNNNSNNRKEKSLPVAEELEVRVDNNNKLDAPTKPNELPPSSQSSTSTPEDPPQDPEYQEMMKTGNSSSNAKARKGKNKARVPTGDDLIEKPKIVVSEQPSTSKPYKGHATTEPDLDILIDGLRGGIKLTDVQLSVVVESLLMRNQNRLNDSKQEADRKRYQRDIGILNEKLVRLNNERTAANITLSDLRNELKTEKDKSKNWEMISQQAMQKCKDDQALASKTINDFRIQCENLHAQLRNSSNPQQLQQLKEQLDRLGKDKYSAEKNNGVLQAETHRLNADLTATQSQMRYLQNENGQLKNENAQLRKQQQTAAPKMTNNYHQSAPAPPKEDNSIWKQELAHAKAEHERDSVKLAQTLAEIKKRDEKEQSQLQEMDRVHKEINSLLKDAETMRSENEVLRQNLKNAEQQVKTGQSDLVNLQQQMHHQTQQMKEQQHKQQKEQPVAVHHQEEVIVAKQSASLESAAAPSPPAAGTQTHDDIKKKYEGMVSDLNEMKTSNERLFSQLGQANKKKDELEKLIGSFQAAANDKQRISELENSLKASEGRVKDLEVKVSAETRTPAAAAAAAASVSKQPSETVVADNGGGSSIEDLESFRCQVDTANTNLKNKQIELDSLRSELEADKRRVEDAEKRCQLAERKMAHLQSKMDNGRIDGSERTAASSEEMNDQRARNNELREKNGVLVKAVRDAEQNVQQASKELTSKYEKALKEAEGQMMSIARKAFPSASPPPKDASQFKDWLQKLEALSSTNSKRSSHTHSEVVRTVVQQQQQPQQSPAPAADSKEAEQLSKERKSLLSQVDQYRNALVQVENDVTTMLKLAESENVAWKAKEAVWNKEKASLVESKKESEAKVGNSSVVQNAEPVCQAATSSSSSSSSSRRNVADDYEQLNALKLENSTLKQTLKKVDKEISGLETLAKGEEVKWVNRIRELEQEINKTNSQVGLTEPSLSTTTTSARTRTVPEEVRRQLADLQCRLEAEEKERSTLTIEINRLERDLVTERANGRDLSAQAVKLRGMLKTGQDALKQEQTLVQQLQIQLKSYQAGGGVGGMNNGTGGWSNKGGHNNHQTYYSNKQQNGNDDDIQSELIQLKKRLSEREEQLQQEMGFNKQLTHKLLALGVATQPLR